MDSAYPPRGAQGDPHAPWPAGAPPAPWPAGTACPLCLRGEISSATFFVEIAGIAWDVTAAMLHDGRRWTTVRCRCCDRCQRRIASVAALRLAALPLVAVGMLSWPVSLATDYPLREWGLGRLEVAMISTLLCAIVVGIPLVLVDRAGRATRKNLEKSWLFRRIKECVALPPVEDLDHQHWKLLAVPPANAQVVEATELLRTAP